MYEKFSFITEEKNFLLKTQCFCFSSFKNVSKKKFNNTRLDPIGALNVSHHFAT